MAGAPKPANQNKLYHFKTSELVKLKTLKWQNQSSRIAKPESLQSADSIQPNLEHDCISVNSLFLRKPECFFDTLNINTTAQTNQVKEEHKPCRGTSTDLDPQSFSAMLPS